MKIQKTVRLTLKNDFHRTETALVARVTKGNELKLSSSQVMRAKAALCAKGCACSGVTGTRNGYSTDITTESGAPVEVTETTYKFSDYGAPGLLLRVHDGKQAGA